MKRLITSSSTYEGLDKLQYGIGDLSNYLNEALRVANEMYYASEGVCDKAHHILNMQLIPQLESMLVDGKLNNGVSGLRAAIKEQRYSS
jgi:hypothetical protein